VIPFDGAGVDELIKFADCVAAIRITSRFEGIVVYLSVIVQLIRNPGNTNPV